MELKMKPSERINKIIGKNAAEEWDRNSSNLSKVEYCLDCIKNPFYYINAILEYLDERYEDETFDEDGYYK